METRETKKVLAAQWKHRLRTATLLPQANEVIEFIIKEVKARLDKQPNVPSLEFEIPYEEYSRWYDRKDTFDIARGILLREWDLYVDIIEGYLTDPPAGIYCRVSPIMRADYSLPAYTPRPT